MMDSGDLCAARSCLSLAVTLRLRMRHGPYAIGAVERDEWMLCMRQALAEQVADPALREAVERAFTGMAEHMVNTGNAAGCPR